MNRRPNSLACGLAVILLCGFQIASTRASTDLQGEIRLEAEREGATWLGRELELSLDIWSNGVSFGDQLFVLPEVKGAYLLQADSSTVKLSENRGGVQWQGLRYTLLLYPQRAGRLEVPSFEVRFSARAGYGTEPQIFNFQTPVKFIDARLPPGADTGGLLVTTSSFSMEASWTPSLPDDGPGQLKVGDAITLEVRRRAQDVPGMVFAPLPEFSIDGLGVYPDPARVNDRINRGSLTGARSDLVTFICEREGDFEIPELRFQWWDPEQEVLSEKVIPARQLVVAANSAYAAGTAAGSRSAGNWLSWKSVAAAIVLLLLLVFSGQSLARFLAGRLRQRSTEWEAGEPWAFRQVQKACAAGAAVEAYNAITVWLSRFDRQRAGLTLMELAVASGDGELLSETTVFQESVAAGSTGEWSGGKLVELLEKLRNRSDRTARHANVLLPLNPPPIKPC
jgi:hypothetical protein